MSVDSLDKVMIERGALRDQLIEAFGPKGGALYFRIRDIAINVHYLDPKLVDEQIMAGIAEGRRRRQVSGP